MNFCEIISNCANVGSPTDCWVWLRGKIGNGYGTVYFEGRNQLVHRIVFEALVGPIPEGRSLHHTCRTRACCNPAHLQPVTQAEHAHLDDTLCSRNRAKTHCPKGHPLEGDNLALIPPSKKLPNGGRFCRTCKREMINDWYRRKQAKAGKDVVKNADKTHCKHGHPLSGENLYLAPDGRRACRICRRRRSLERYHRDKT